MKNIIIGYGETLTKEVSIKSGSGKKRHPYTFEEAKKYFVTDLTKAINDLKARPLNQSANGEVVLKFLQHPSYLAKSYFPNQFTVSGLSTGTFTIEARAEDSDAFESVENGTISDLSMYRTLIIESTAISEIRTTVSAGTPYTLTVKQTNFKDE